MRKISALFALVALSVSTSVFATPTAWYNPVTGNVRLANDTGGVLGAIFMISNSNSMTSDGGAFAQVPGTVFDPGDLPSGWTYLSFPAQADSSYASALPIGNVVTPGTPLSDLVLQYRVSLTGGNPSNGVVLEVPEPATAALAGLGLIGFAIRRRKSA